jgi:hypothetical protein
MATTRWCRACRPDAHSGLIKAAALQDFPVEPLHLVGSRCGFGAKPAIAVQVKGDALEEMPQIIDAEAATLEYLDLVVEGLNNKIKVLW